MLHWMIADRCIRELGAQPPEGGLPLPSVPADYKLPKPSRWIVDWAVRHVKETIPPDWSLLVEAEFIIEFGTWRSTGHHDIFARSPCGKKCKGKDWKTGNKPAEPALFNEQVLTYLVQTCSEFTDLEEAEFEICQPRASEDDGFERVSRVTLTGPQIQAAIRSLDSRVIEAQQNPMRLCTGLVQCCYCPAQNQCPAIRAEIENMKLLMTPEMLAAIKTDTPDEVLGDIAVAAKLLDKPFETAKDTLKERLATRGTLQASDGTRITAKTTNGSVAVKEPAAFYRTLRSLLPDEDKRAECLSFPIGRIRTAIAEEMSIPETGKSPITASSIVDAQLKSYCEQGTRTVLLFS